MECLDNSGPKHAREIDMKSVQNTYQNWSCDFCFENYLLKNGGIN